MKKLLSVLLLVVLMGGLGISKVQAQYVTISDTAFVRWLHLNYPSCMNGNQLDTNCTAVLNAVALNLDGFDDGGNPGLVSLTGVQYFKNADTLRCGATGLTALPQLPPALKYLECRDCQRITSIPAFPSTLQYLDCSADYNVGSLPAFPATLIYLNCFVDNLTTLPALPSSLQYLNCGDNSIQTIPTLPSTLQTLMCANAHLTALPALPSTLQYLDCSYNSNIPALPTLPSSLTYLNCSEDLGVSSLPVLPSSLQYLNCDGDPLHTLPGLPAGLQTLSCQNVLATNLPTLPSSLQTLYCGYGPLNNLPVLPAALQYLDCSFDQSMPALPALPAGLQYLYCNYDSFRTLPALPASLTTLVCSGCPVLSTLPALPDSMYQLALDSSGITCLPYLTRIVNLSFTRDNVTCVPNIGNVTTSNPVLNTLPLCQSGNTHGCLYAGGTLTASAGPDTTICSSSPYELGGSPTATAGTPPYTYAWSPATGLSSPFDQNPWVTGVIGNTTYTVTVTDASHNTATSSVTVITTAPPTSTFTATSPVSVGAVSTIIYTGNATGGATYSWNFNGGTVVSGSNAGPYQVSWSTPGTKIVTLQIYDGACTSNVTTETVLVTTGPVYNTVHDSTLTNQAWFYCVNTNGVIDTGRLLAVQQPVNGTIGKVRVGNQVCLTYTPAYNFIGYDTFWIQQCSDTAATCDTTIVIMHVYSACYLCVWPGDANDDGIVNNADLLSIGIGYGTTGPVRPNATINWVGQPAPYWTDSLLDSTNYKFIDCNGDGTINADDTVAIVLNYSSTHARSGGISAGGPGAPTLLPAMVEDTTYNGDTLTVQLVLGDLAHPANNIYGLAFTLNYDITAVDSTKAIGVTFGNSWLGTAADKISIAKDFKQQGQLQCALTRIDHTTRSGYGTIGTVSIIVTTDNINGKDYSYYLENFFISNVTMIDSIGDILPVNSGSGSTLVGYFPTGIAQVNSISNLVHIYPNPASNQLQIISGAGAISEIKITDVTGREVLNHDYLPESIVTKQLLNLSALNPGIYLVEVLTANGVAVQKLIVAR